VQTDADVWLQRERGRKESLSALRIETAQLRGVLWVLLVHPYFGVTQPIRSSWDGFVDEIWTFPW
jgi:hypothetical protein